MILIYNDFVNNTWSNESNIPKKVRYIRNKYSVSGHCVDDNVKQRQLFMQPPLMVYICLYNHFKYNHLPLLSAEQEGISLGRITVNMSGVGTLE